MPNQNPISVEDVVIIAPAGRDDAASRQVFIAIATMLIGLVALAPVASMILGLTLGGDRYVVAGGVNIMVLLPATLLALMVIWLRPARIFSGWVERGLFLTLLCWGLFGALVMAPDPGVSTIMFLMLVVMVGGGCVASAAGERFARVAMWALVVAAALLLALPFIQEVIVSEAAEKRPWHILVPGFGNLRTLGYVLSVGAAAGVGLLLAGSASRSTTAFAFIVTTLAVALLAWSGGRAGFLGLVLGLGVALVVARRAPKHRFALVAGATALGLMLASFLYLPTSAYGVLSRSVDGVASVVAATDIARVGDGAASKAIAVASSGRMRLWSWTIERISERPLFGHGYWSISEHHDGSLENNAHNIFLELAFGMGVPAALVICAWLALATARSIIAAVRLADPATAPMVAVMVCVGFDAALSPAISAPWSGLAFAIAIGATAGHLARR